ncbi:MAG: hypothetical protein IT247_01565 [Bacteroidia bacterium]|nr:hypothetical protein [Bacteroidia bacterium]
MKIHPTLLLSVVALLTLNLHCEKDETTPPDQLPPYSQIGANTMGCLVNGRVFIPREHDLTGKYFGCHDDDLTLYIDRNGERVYIAIMDHSVLDTGEYDLTYTILKKHIYYRVETGFGGIDYITNSLHTGKLHIRCWDKQKHVMAGTFSFDAVGVDSSIVHITDGRFDMIYN